MASIMPAAKQKMPTQLFFMVSSPRYNIHDAITLWQYAIVGFPISLFFFSFFCTNFGIPVAMAGDEFPTAD